MPKLACFRSCRERLTHPLLAPHRELIVGSYKCEWTEVVKDEKRRADFVQFVNTADTERGIEFVNQRGQRRPTNWPVAADGTLSSPMQASVR